MFDRKNTARMKEIIGEHGWPGETPSSRSPCLPLMEKEVRAGEASAKDWAYLLDRGL